MANNESWAKIFSDYNILEHNFDEAPFELSAQNIKTSCQNFTEVNQKEVRVLCKQDTRTDRPQIFIDNGLFLLPSLNSVLTTVSKVTGFVIVFTFLSNNPVTSFP